MLNNKLSNDKAFSFGKSSAAAIGQKTNDFKADSGDNSNQRGRNFTKKNENNQSGGVLLTFGLDRENLQRTKHYYTPPHDSRSGGNIGSALYVKKNKNIESQIDNKMNNYNTNKDSEKNQDNLKLKTNANPPPVNNFYLKNADKLINAKDCNNSTSNQNSNINSPLKNNEANSSRNNLGLNNNGKKKVVINESNNVYNTLNEKREKSWSYPDRTLQNNYNTNSQRNLNKNSSKRNLNALNTTNKSFSQEQYSEYMKIKNNGLVRDLSQTTLENRNERSASPFFKLKEKLSDNFMHFLKKHRFSAVMVGNSLFHGKTGNFYINMKNNKDDLQNINPEFLNNSNLLNTLENSHAKDKQDKGLNDREGKCHNDSMNQILNLSLDETEKKIFDENTKDYINSNSINHQNKNNSDNNLINTNSKSSFNPADGNTKVLFDPNHIQENYKNYKDSLNNNKLDDTLNFNTNQTEEKYKEDFNMQNKNPSNLNKKEELKSSSYSKMPAVYQNQLNSTGKKSSVDVNANKSGLYNISVNKKNEKNPTPSISSYGNNAAKLAQNSTKKPIGKINNSSVNSTSGGTKLYSTISNNNVIKVNNVRNSNPAVGKLNNNNIKINQNTNTKGSTQNLNAKSNFSNRKGSIGKVADATATPITANKKENLLINKSNLMAESEKKSNSQSKISKDSYDKYSNYYLNQKSNQPNDKNNNEPQLNNLNNSNLSNGTSMRSSSNRTIIYNPSNSNLAVESRNNEALNKTRSRNNLNSIGKNLETSRSGNNLNTLQNENNVNNNNYINTNSNSNNYYNLLNTSTHKLANSMSTKKLNNGALLPEEILSYEAFKNLERIISLQKGFVDLTPIPMKKEDLKSRVDQIEYSAAERAAVLIRRMEYSHNLKNSKVELSENETKEFYLKLLIEAKTIIIQRWWRKMLKRLCIYHLGVQRIQTAFRGYMFREAFRFALRNTKVVFPFITKLIEIIHRNLLMPPFNLMRRLYKDQTHFEFVVKQICKIQLAFRGFSRRRLYRISVLKGFCLAKHFNSLKFYFEKLKVNISLLKKVILLQSRARGMNARNPRLFQEKELEALKSFEESKDKKYEEVNNTISNNRNMLGNTNNNNGSNSNSKNHSPNKYAEDPNVANYKNNILGRKTYHDIGLRLNSRHRSSILNMIKDEKYIRYSPLLMSYLSCQRLHNSRRLGYREYQTQKFYLIKFVEKTSVKYLRRKKANQMRIRNNAIGYMLNVREKILKNFYFKKYRKVSESLGKLGRKALMLMKTTLRIFVWSKLIQKINRKILKHAAFKCVKNYMLRIQLNVLRKKFQVFKINATQKGKQILKLHQLSDKFNKKNAKVFFDKFNSLYKLTPKKLKTYERFFQAVKILNTFLTKKAFNSIKFIQFMKMKRFVGFVTGKFLVPKALKYKKLAFEKIMTKNLDNKKKLEKAKIGFDLLHKYQKNLYQKVFENIKQKIRNKDHHKYIENNYKLKNSNMAAKEKFSYAKTFEILEKILTRKERKFLQTLKKIGISNKFFNSGVKIIYKILSKKLLEYSYYFFSRLTSKHIFKHFNGILKSKEFEENNLNKITKANQILNNFILKKGKKANFEKLKKFVMTKDQMERENKLKLKKDLMKDLFMKKIDQNINLKKLYFYKLVRIVRGINFSECAYVFSGLAAFILNKIKKMKLKSLLEKFANKLLKQKLAEIKSLLNTIDNECYNISQNGKKKFVNKKGGKFMANDEVENKIRYKLILLGSKFDKKFILQKYFDKLKLNKINDLNKIKKIQTCFRKQTKKAEAKKCLIKKLFENMLFKYQKLKEKYFYKFANEIIAKKHKRSATTLRDFMRNYTLAAKKRRLLLKLLNQKDEDYYLVLLEKFQRFKGSNCLIYYSHRKGLAGRKFEIRNSSIDSNFNDNYNEDNKNEKNSNLNDEEDNNYNIKKTYKASFSMEETNPPSNFGLDSNNNDKKMRSNSKSFLIKSDNIRSNFKYKKDTNFGNDSKNSSDKNKRITLIVDKNEKGKFPSIIQGGSDEEYDSQEDQKKDAKGKSDRRLHIVNEETDDNKSSQNNELENDYNNTRPNINNNRFIKHTSPNENNNSNRKEEHTDDEENYFCSNGNVNKIRDYNTKKVEDNNKADLNKNDNDFDDQKKEKKFYVNRLAKNIDTYDDNSDLNKNDNDSYDQLNEKKLNVNRLAKNIDTKNNKTELYNDCNDSDDQPNEKKFNVKGANKDIDTNNNKIELNQNDNDSDDQIKDKKFNVKGANKDIDTKNNKIELNQNENDSDDQIKDKKFNVKGTNKDINTKNNKIELNQNDNDSDDQLNEKKFNVKGTNKDINTKNNKTELNQNDYDPNNQPNEKKFNVKGTNKDIDSKNYDKNTKNIGIRGKNQIIKIEDLNIEKTKIEAAISQHFSPKNNSEGNEDNHHEDSNCHFVKNLKIRRKSSIVIDDKEKLNELKEKIDSNKTNDPDEDGKTGDNQLNNLKNNLLPVKDSTNENQNENGNEIKINNIENNTSNKNFSKLNKVTDSDLELKNQNSNKNHKSIENDNDQKAALQRNSRFNFSNLYSRKSVNESKSADTAADEQNKELKTSKTTSNLLKQNLNDDSNSDNKGQKNSNSSGHYHYDKKTNPDEENLNGGKIKNFQDNKINKILNIRSSNVSDNPSRKSSNGKFSTSNLRQFNKINTSLRNNDYSDNVENEDFEEKENQNSDNSDKNINNNDLNENNKDSENRSKTRYEIKSNLFRKDKDNEKNNSSKNLKKNNNNGIQADDFNQEEKQKENLDDEEEYYTNQRVLNQKRTQGNRIDIDSYQDKSKNDKSNNGDENDFKKVHAKNTFKKYTEETPFKYATNKDINNRGEDEKLQEDLVNQDNNYTDFGNRIIKQSRTYKKATTKDLNTDYNKSNFENKQNKNEDKPDENNSTPTDKYKQIYQKTENNIEISSLKDKHDKTADEAYSDFIGKNDPKDKNNNNNNEINKFVLKNKNIDKIDNDVFNNIQNKKSSNTSDCPTSGNEINKLNNYLKTNIDKDMNHEELYNNNTPNYENFMIDLNNNNSNSLRDMLRKLSDSHSIEGKFNTNNDNEFCEDLFDTKTKNTLINLNNKFRKNSSNINYTNNDYKSVSTNIVTDVTNINNSKITRNAYGSQVNNFEKSDEENTDNFENSKNLNNLLIKNYKSNEDTVGNDNDNGNPTPSNLNINNLNNKLIPGLTDSKKKKTLEKEINEYQNDEDAKELKGKSTKNWEVKDEEPNSNSKNLKINSNSRINNIQDENDSNYKDNNKINKRIEKTNTKEGNDYSIDVVEIKNIKKKVLTIKKFKKSGQDFDSNSEPDENQGSENMGEPDHDEEQVLKLNAHRLRDELLVKTTPTKEIEEEEIKKKNMLKNYIKRLSFKNDNNNTIDMTNDHYKKNDNNVLEAIHLIDNREEVNDKSIDRNDDKNEENKKEETKRDPSNDSSSAKYLNPKNLLKQENIFNNTGRKEEEEVIDEAEYPGLVHDQWSKEVSPTENSIKRSTIKEKRRSFNEFIIRKEKLKMLILKQTNKNFNEYSKIKFYEFWDKIKLSIVDAYKYFNNNLKNNKNGCFINNENKEEARRILFDMFNFYYRKTEISDIVMFLRVLKRDSSISKIQKFWRRKSFLLKERKIKNVFAKRIIAKEVIMNRALYNTFDKWLKQVQKISEYIVRLTKFRRLQNLLHRFTKDIVLNVLIKTLSSKKIELYEQVC